MLVLIRCHDGNRWLQQKKELHASRIVECGYIEMGDRGTYLKPTLAQARSKQIVVRVVSFMFLQMLENNDFFL